MMQVQENKTDVFEWVLRSDSGKEIELKGTMTVGREEFADLCVADHRVSRKHAAFRLTQSGVMLEDLGSANGTLVNGSPITQAVMLNPDDVINFHADNFTLHKLAPIKDIGLSVRSEQLGNFELKGEISIGRDAQCDIHLDDEIISRRHAAIRVTRSGAIIEDFGSINGTYLNGKRIEKSAFIEEGDQLRFCDKVFNVCKTFDPDATRIAMKPFDPDATQIMAVSSKVSSIGSSNTPQPKQMKPEIVDRSQETQSGFKKTETIQSAKIDKQFDAEIESDAEIKVESQQGADNKPSAIQKQQLDKVVLNDNRFFQFEEASPNEVNLHEFISKPVEVSAFKRLLRFLKVGH